MSNRLRLQPPLLDPTTLNNCPIMILEKYSTLVTPSTQFHWDKNIFLVTRFMELKLPTVITTISPMVKCKSSLAKNSLEMSCSTSSSSPTSSARAHLGMFTRSGTLPNSSKNFPLFWRYLKISISWAKKFKPSEHTRGDTRQRLSSPELTAQWPSTWVLQSCHKHCLMACSPKWSQ